MIISETESEPDSYPSAPGDLSDDALGVTTAVVWKRIEDWIRYRWAERQVVWIVEGPGVFVPRLLPATIDTREVWNGEAWETVTLDPAPLGDKLDAKTYRITATVGSTDNPPPTVMEAYTRLAEYTAHAEADPAQGHTRVSDGDYSFDRPATYAARALHYSGAADLLRGYR